MKEVIKKTIASVVFLLLVYILQAIIIHPVTFYHIFSSSNKMYSSYEMDNSEVVKNITKYCMVFNGENEVKCIVETMGMAFSYNHTRANKKMYFPLIKKTDDFNTGYICRDIAVSYDAIFRNLGYNTDFIFTHNHIYNHIWKDDIVCEINMEEFYCW